MTASRRRRRQLQSLHLLHNMDCFRVVLTCLSTFSIWRSKQVHGHRRENRRNGFSSRRHSALFWRPAGFVLSGIRPRNTHGGDDYNSFFARSSGRTIRKFEMPAAAGRGQRLAHRQTAHLSGFSNLVLASPRLTLTFTLTLTLTTHRTLTSLHPHFTSPGQVRSGGEGEERRVM